MVIPSTFHAFDKIWLGIVIGVATLIILKFRLLNSLADQRISAEAIKRVEALRQSEERFRSLVQNSSDMITVLDTDGTIRYLSPSIERILGYKPALRLSHEREKLLNQISRALNTCLEPNYILQEIVKLTGECFGVDRVLVYRLETEHVQVLKEWRSCKQVISIIGFKLPWEETLQSLQN